MNRNPLAQAAAALRATLRARREESAEEHSSRPRATGHEADRIAAGTPSKARPHGRRRPPVVVVEPGGSTRSVPLDQPAGSSRAHAREGAGANRKGAGTLAAAAAAAREQQQGAGADSVFWRAVLTLVAAFGGVLATFWALTHPVAAVSWSVALGGLALVVLCRATWSPDD